MNPFDPSATCPKCGHDEVSSVYSPYRKWETIYYNDPDKECEEHIHRRCKRCNYAWNEAPLDRGEDG